MALLSTIDLCNSRDTTGANLYATWRKAPTQATANGIWFDLSLSPGNPNPQYYAAAPLTSTNLASNHGGLPASQAVSPATKYLQRMMALCSTAACLPMQMIVLDYLMFYAFCDETVTGPQTMTQSAVLTRYANGVGVQMMAVATAAQTGGQSFTVSYTNSAGVSGRTTAPVTTNAQGLIGTILTSATATNGAAGPFLPLQSPDTGVQSIQSINFATTDIGLVCLVLVKPIASLNLPGIDAVAEVDYFKDFSVLPIIQDNAYLNLICMPAGSLNGAVIHGEIITNWG